MSEEFMPYIDHNGCLVIPFNSAAKYHHWNGGQSLMDTLLELNCSQKIWENYSHQPYPGNNTSVREEEAV